MLSVPLLIMGAMGNRKMSDGKCASNRWGRRNPCVASFLNFIQGIDRNIGGTRQFLSYAPFFSEATKW